MPVVRTLGRAAVLALALVPLAGTPAHAAQPWHMNLSIREFPGGFNVCAEGESWWWGGDQQWTLTIAGSRSDGSRITGAAGSSDYRFAACVPVYTHGTDSGEFTAAFVYVSATSLDYGNEYGTAGWAPAVGSFVATT